jgi:hypothetical protein
MSALTHLSLAHCPPHLPVPAPLSNADRLRAFRAVAEPDLANGHPWPFLRGIRDAAPDWGYFHEHSYDQLSQGF